MSERKYDEIEVLEDRRAELAERERQLAERERELKATEVDIEELQDPAKLRASFRELHRDKEQLVKERATFESAVKRAQETIRENQFAPIESKYGLPSGLLGEAARHVSTVAEAEAIAQKLAAGIGKIEDTEQDTELTFEEYKAWRAQQKAPEYRAIEKGAGAERMSPKDMDEYKRWREQQIYEGEEVALWPGPPEHVTEQEMEEIRQRPVEKDRQVDEELAGMRDYANPAELAEKVGNLSMPAYRKWREKQKPSE